MIVSSSVGAQKVAGLALAHLTAMISALQPPQPEPSSEPTPPPPNDLQTLRKATLQAERKETTNGPSYPNSQPLAQPLKQPSPLDPESFQPRPKQAGEEDAGTSSRRADLSQQPGTDKSSQETAGTAETDILTEPYPPIEKQGTFDSSQETAGTAETEILTEPYPPIPIRSEHAPCTRSEPSQTRPCGGVPIDPENYSIPTRLDEVYNL
jgi:hypothetical protein